DDCDKTAMHAAAGNDHANVIELLYQKRADINLTSRNGCTPLMDSCCEGFLTSTQLLLRLGASPSNINKEGYTARAFALFQGHKQCSELLPKDFYTEEFIQRKILAHVYSIKGMTKIGSFKFELEGAFFPLMHECIATDLESFLSKNVNFLPKISQERLLSAF